MLPSQHINRFYLDQHGCAKNQVDGELLIAHLEHLGWELTEDPSDASLIIINSCGFIESAKKESINSLIAARNEYPDTKIVLAGCLSQRYASVFAKDLNEADAIFGNGDLSKIHEIISSLFPKNQKDYVCVDKPVIVPPQEGVCSGDRIKILNFPGSAYVKITEGCNNCCTFCAIPLIRGSLRSRSIEEICTEIEKLISSGIFEINLIGQDLASYGTGLTEKELFSSVSSPLSRLLLAISQIKGSFWIRLLYIHPDNFPLDILPLIQKDQRILPYFDIPFQSGDEKIIESMNRHSSPNEYVSLVEKIRNACKKSFYEDSAIRTTFLCGFPGETEEAAQNTQDFLRVLNPDWSGCFVYSKEEDTKAYDMKNQVPKKIAKKRMNSLVDIQGAITQKLLSRHVRRQYTVLVEELIEDSQQVEGLAIGRAWFQAPDVDGSCVIRYDLDDEQAVSAVQSGKTILVEVIGSSDVDLDTVFIQSLPLSTK